MGTARAIFLSLLFSCTLSSCYRPNYSGPYACDQRRGDADCPDGFRCMNRLCVAPSGVPATDPNSACASGGTLLVMAHGARAWACPGSFAAGDYESLCSSTPGTHVCGQDLRDDALLALIDCDGLSGFYVAHGSLALVKNATDYEPKCEAPPGSGERALLGCGIGAGAVRFNSPDCRALHHALLCPASGAWSCSTQDGLLSATHDASSDKSGGTLCCTGDPR